MAKWFRIGYSQGVAVACSSIANIVLRASLLSSIAWATISLGVIYLGWGNVPLMVLGGLGVLVSFMFLLGTFNSLNKACQEAEKKSRR